MAKNDASGGRGPVRSGDGEPIPQLFGTDGVRGTAGNVRDWTATEWVEGEGASARVARAVRGGAWLGQDIHTRCADRNWWPASRLTCQAR